MSSPRTMFGPSPVSFNGFKVKRCGARAPVGAMRAARAAKVSVGVGLGVPVCVVGAWCWDTRGRVGGGDVRGRDIPIC